jgi:O-phosphoseryl-tRNA synthetase
LSDAQLAEQVKIALEPGTAEGRELALKISQTARKYADEQSPCRFPAYEGEFLSKFIKVHVLEKESDTKLLGPAALNEIYVCGGNVYGIPKNPEKLSGELVEVKNKGIKVKFNVLDAVSYCAASEIEKIIKAGGKSGFVQVKMAKTPADLNIEIGKAARRFITSMNKKIILKGPVFMSVEVEVE